MVDLQKVRHGICVHEMASTELPWQHPARHVATSKHIDYDSQRLARLGPQDDLLCAGVTGDANHCSCRTDIMAQLIDDRMDDEGCKEPKQRRFPHIPFDAQLRFLLTKCLQVDWRIGDAGHSAFMFTFMHRAVDLGTVRDPFNHSKDSGEGRPCVG